MKAIASLYLTKGNVNFLMGKKAQLSVVINVLFVILHYVALLNFRGQFAKFSHQKCSRLYALRHIVLHIYP